MSLRTIIASTASARPAVRDRIATVPSSLLYMVLRRLLGIFSSKDRADAQVQLENLVLRHQVAILRRQVKRAVYSRRDRALLAAASRILPRNRWNTFLVRPETLLRWHKGLVARKWTRPHRRPGRPAIDPEVRRLILLMAKENSRWGYMRIKGELQKLGIRVSATAIGMLLRRHGIGPAPAAAGVAPVPEGVGFRHHRLRFLHDRDGASQDALGAVLHRDRDSARARHRLNEQPGLGLCHPAGPKPCDEPF